MATRKTSPKTKAAPRMKASIRTTKSGKVIERSKKTRGNYEFTKTSRGVNKVKSRTVTDRKTGKVIRSVEKDKSRPYKRKDHADRLRQSKSKDTTRKSGVEMYKSKRKTKGGMEKDKIKGHTSSRTSTGHTSKQRSRLGKVTLKRKDGALKKSPSYTRKEIKQIKPRKW
jgi:hypothetical protein